MMRAVVTVTPTRGILDPQGKAVAHSLRSLGYEEVEVVRIGKVLDLKLEGTDPGQVESRVREMCDRLLANGVIEDYAVELVDEAPR